MRAKQYLEQIRWLDIKINDKLTERDQLWAKATKITPTISPDKCSGGTVTDKVGNIVVKIIELDKEINAQIDEFVSMKDKIIHEIESLHDERYSMILYKRYVNYIDLSLIAQELHYDYKYILNLHGYALKAFDDKFLKRSGTKWN